MRNETKTVDTFAELMRILRSGERSMPASQLYRVCGVLPDTVRKSRARAANRGMPNPLPFLGDGTYNIDLRDAVSWLQKTGRYGAMIRLHAHLEEVATESATIVRGFRTKHSLGIPDKSELNEALASFD